MKTQIGIAILLLLIVSCAPFSKEVMQDVKKDIAFREALKTPEAFKGESVIWGGIIIETIARADDSLIIVRQTDLDFQKQPINPDISAGRFMIRYKGFLDPAIYSADREVTVVGTLAGKEERPIGEYRYAYPVVDARDVHLWERRMESPYYYDPWFWGPYPRYPRPLYHPYWW